MRTSVVRTVAPLLAALIPVGAARAQDAGVSGDRILFGQSAAMTGPAGELGRELRLGILAAFRELNRRGGVHGRRLELVSLDDAYEPEAAIANTRKLIEEDQVFALIGAVGTPTSRSAAPIAAAAGVPYIAPFTGAGLLRSAELKNVVNLRASYDQETEEIVARLIGDLGIERIGVLYQDDSFGRAGLIGAERGLLRRGLKPVALGTFVRNSTAVKTALLDLRKGEPEAVILVGPYKPVATAIAWSRRLAFDPVFVTISFSGGNALARELGDMAEGVYVTQVVPFPTDAVRIARSYRNALAALAPKAEPGFVSFEGYLAGRLTIVGLQRCGEAVNRARFLDSVLRGSPISLDGFSLRFDEGDNQGSDRVFLTVIGKGGQYSPVAGLQPAKKR